MLHGLRAISVTAQAIRLGSILRQSGRAEGRILYVMGGPAMQPPLFIRPLSAAEAREIKASLRSHDVFTLRRSQILLASARGYHSS